FEDDLDLEILGAIAAGVGKIHQNLRHIHEGRRLYRRRCDLHLLAMAEEEQVTGRRRAAEHQNAGGGDDDQLERQLALGLRSGLVVALLGVRLRGGRRFCLCCHTTPPPPFDVSSSQETSNPRAAIEPRALPELLCCARERCKRCANCALETRPPLSATLG